MAAASCNTFQLRHVGFLSHRSNHSSRLLPIKNVEIRPRMTVSARSMTDDRVDMDENPSGVISGEWPENFSLLSFDDLRGYLETHVFDDDKIKRPSVFLCDVMSTTIRSAYVDQTLEEIDHLFDVVCGLPVLDHDHQCVGVISKNDRSKATNGMMSKVSEVMSSPAITLTPDRTVMEAAALMLRKKIHRIPVQNKEGKIIGMVTRTNILQALETVMA